MWLENRSKSLILRGNHGTLLSVEPSAVHVQDGRITPQFAELRPFRPTGWRLLIPRMDIDVNRLLLEGLHHGLITSRSTVFHFHQELIASGNGLGWARFDMDQVDLMFLHQNQCLLLPQSQRETSKIQDGLRNNQNSTYLEEL
jgi:hypothetical protein